MEPEDQWCDHRNLRGIAFAGECGEECDCYECGEKTNEAATFEIAEGDERSAKNAVKVECTVAFKRGEVEKGIKTITEKATGLKVACYFASMRPSHRYASSE
jgi:hypothetical protein